ncbi:uncharacterized protein EHS24_005263 [Apiotrichum porosum]|uniref:Uncharacterized protein n=1 Tax=Apiotrichum porosum TaxID=105984 RepID=A0A427XDF7_9TREE|nr:uncharacterized protein EHS24_005263 [Apiotrichum porosum]RSH76862.1 hypothetical protein EHS24_005263 [Apiotrichum porosum]
MAATFPQLLKRSAFAAHDPVITRVYASNPRSINAYNDWGLKFPVHRAKGSRFLKVRQLDAGPGVDAPWESAEKEARFMDTWGDGSVPWKAPIANRMPQRAGLSLHSGINSQFYEQDHSHTTQHIPNVEAMSEAEFETYLKHVREHRKEFAQSIFTEGARGESAPAHERTLAHAATHQYLREDDSAEFQVKLAARELADRDSKRIVSDRHAVSGLRYAAPLSGKSGHSIAPAHPGRVLDRVTRIGGTQAEGTNAKWVVGLGGLTTVAPSGVARTSDKATLGQFDYTRARPDVGISDFNVENAVLTHAPRVLGLGSKSDGGQRWLKKKYSGARRPGPLTSMSFNIDVVEDTDVELGTPAYVAREVKRPGPLVSEASMGVLTGMGGPKADRVRRTKTTRVVHSTAIKTVLAKIAVPSPESSSS